MDKKAMMGHKIRRLRLDQSMSQTEMADALSISPSYLNLIEHNQRPLTVPLLFRLGQAFDIDLKNFAADDDARLAAGLREVFSDSIFEGQAVRDTELRELAAVSPVAAEAVLSLYEAYRTAREDVQALVQRIADPDQMAKLDSYLDPVEELRDFFQSHSNHFPELEQAAQALWEEADLERDDLFRRLQNYLDSAHRVAVRVMPADIMQDTLRRYDLHRRRVLLSETLNASARRFQLAVQIALLSHGALLDRLIQAAGMSSPEAERLARIGLAGYFAGAVLMPYDRFLQAAIDMRYDIEVLQNRFSASFEQVCHRLTTMQRPGARGVSFFFIRVDHAGNVSKRLNGAGFNFARFGGTCPRWIVHEAFLTPGHILSQIATMPDNTAFFTIARMLDQLPMGHRQPQPKMAIALGCDIKQAPQLVYGDALDLKNLETATPIGVSCRVCERMDCNLRAHPPLNQRLRVDENIRRIAPFATPPS